jgi:hypothetical protein
MAAVVYVRETLVTAHDGGTVKLTAGDPWDANHPLVRSRPELFSESPTRLNGRPVRAVEEATARPGEKRDVRRG